MPSEKKLPDGRWRVFVSGGTGADRTRANATRVTLREARVAARDTLDRKLRERDLELHPGELLADLMADHRDLHAAVHLSPSTQRGYEGIRTAHADPALGKLALTDVTPTVLLRYQAAKLKDLSALTVEHHMSYLRSVLAFGVRTKRLEWNAAEAVKSAHKPRGRRRRALTLDEVAELLTAALAAREREPKRKVPKPPDLYGPLLVAVTSGLRRGELLALSWPDVDLDSGVVRASRSVVKPVGKAIVTKATKAEAEDVRIILLPKIVTEELKAEHRRQAERRLRQPGWNAGQLVFPRHDGRHRQPDTFTHAVGRLLDECGIEGADLHSLRHTHSTVLHELGADITIIRSRQGHADVRMTERYVHDTVKVQKPAAARLNRALSEKLMSHPRAH